MGHFFVQAVPVNRASMLPVPVFSGQVAPPEKAGSTGPAVSILRQSRGEAGEEAHHLLKPRSPSRLPPLPWARGQGLRGVPGLNWDAKTCKVKSLARLALVLESNGHSGTGLRSKYLPARFLLAAIGSVKRIADTKGSCSSGCGGCCCC